jgi:hypothetical protein
MENIGLIWDLFLQILTFGKQNPFVTARSRVVVDIYINTSLGPILTSEIFETIS